MLEALAALLICSTPASSAPFDEDAPPIDAAAGPVTGPQPAPRPPLNLYSLLGPEGARVELERRHLEGGPLHVLIERVTRGLLAAPYLLSPLGEGIAPDPDPRFRMDAFDCTTFVETALVLARCDDLDEIRAHLDRIRYLGPPRFENRRHLMTAQWIPGLVEAGYVRDITKEVGKKKTIRVSLELDAGRWKKRRIAKSLEIPPDKLPKGEFVLPVIPIEVMLDPTTRVPPGTILNVVRMSVPWSPVVISHQGVVLVPRGETTRIVRHASPVAKRVVDEPLSRMMTRYLKPRKWPIVGVNLLQIIEPSPGTTPTATTSAVATASVAL